MTTSKHTPRFTVEPATSPRGLWTIRDRATGETSGLYGSAAAAAPKAARREREANADAEKLGEWITVTDLGRPVQAMVIRKSHASTDVETIGGKVWRFHSDAREIASATFVRDTNRPTDAIAVEEAKFERAAENIAIAGASGRLSQHDVDERTARLRQRTDNRIAYLRGEKRPTQRKQQLLDDPGAHRI
jgi:hypothetical protein